MIDIRKLKELVRLMVANELTELDLRDSEEQVTLRRHSPNHAATPTVAAPAAVQLAAPASAAAPTATAEPVSGESPSSAGAIDAQGLVNIESPMVGTFYTAADPDSTPFVNVGTSVGPETVVCLVEAMKIFNEIKAESAGTVEKVLVKNGEAVEFGQPLFLLKPD